jgi:hypothetical protein
VNIEEIENILDVYDIEEIFELNGIETVDVLYFLVEQEFIELPKIRPL